MLIEFEILACLWVIQNWTVHGLYWGSHRMHQPGVLEDSVKEPLSWLSRGLIKIHISHSYNLSEVSSSFHSLVEECLTKEMSF